MNFNSPRKVGERFFILSRKSLVKGGIKYDATLLTVGKLASFFSQRRRRDQV